MAINIKLAALMAKKKISLTELAEKIGITRPTSLYSRRARVELSVSPH
jgi:DNA-binding Xre family transcriptional regulator